VKNLRLLIKIACADFLERSRRYSFLVTIGIMILIGYVVIPPLESGALTVDLGNIRGVYNTAWIGGVVALLSSMLLSLPGFYLVKNAVSRDRETRVGQIIATTPLTKPVYTLAKMFSNFVYLTFIIAVVMIASGVMQFVRGEVLTFHIFDLILPFLLVTLPMMALVSAVAVFFEVIPFFRGGFGNIFYFVLFLVAIVVSLSGVGFNEQGMIVNPVNDMFGASLVGASMSSCAHQAFPAHQLNFGVGYTITNAPIQTFIWQGVHWTLTAVLGRLLWAAIALGLALVSALVFDRFDPAQNKIRKDRRQGLIKRLWSKVQMVELPQFKIFSAIRPGLLNLSPFWRLIAAETGLLLRGLHWWWYVVAVVLAAAAAVNEDLITNQGLLLAAWLWPVLVWSKLGVMANLNHTQKLIFSSPYPLKRQLSATWISGVLVSVLTGVGVGVYFVFNSDWQHLLGWLVAVVFIPSLALCLGTWSKSSKPFEALYVVWWYLGPVSQVPGFDFMILNPTTGDSMPYTLYITAAASLLALAFLGRKLQLEKTGL